MSTTATQPAFTTEFASTYKDMMLGRIENEQKTTRKVIVAIPNQKLDYKHDPKGRTALELAHHIVVSEIWFLNSIADGKFDWRDPALAKTTAEMADMKKMMNDPIIGSAMVFIEPFPVGLLVTLISAAVLRKK